MAQKEYLRFDLRLYRLHDLDLITLYLNPGINFNSFVYDALRAYFSNERFVLPYTPITDSMPDAKDIKPSYTIGIAINKTDENYIVDGLSRLRPRRRTAFIKGVLRSSLGFAVVDYCFEDNHAPIPPKVTSVRNYEINSQKAKNVQKYERHDYEELSNMNLPYLQQQNVPMQQPLVAQTLSNNFAESKVAREEMVERLQTKEEDFSFEKPPTITTVSNKTGTSVEEDFSTKNNDNVQANSNETQEIKEVVEKPSIVKEESADESHVIGEDMFEIPPQEDTEDDFENLDVDSLMTMGGM